ncbi:MAG: DUF2723 domain-containing protein [Dehalococcoidia bacterium]|nr:DUF2723 domain-containing protein [Dehalococcoidia bacterium]
MALAVAACALAVYAPLVAPTLTWRNVGGDGGDLAAAVAVLGVPHPSGYPTYMLLGRIFSAVLPWGDVAYRLNLMSAAFSAAAAGLLYLAARLLHELAFRAEMGSPGMRRATAAIGALAYAFAPLPWSQATITEVYALHAFFAATVLLCTLGLLHTTSFASDAGKMTPWLIGGALATGLGLGNHTTLALVAAPGVFLALALRRRIPSVALAPAALLAGLAVFAYLPWRAAADPPVNWGDASNLGGFVWLTTGQPYRHYLFGLPASLLPERLASYAGYLVQQFNPVGFGLAVVGLALLWTHSRTLSVLTLGTALFISVFAVLYNTTDSYVYLLPVFMVMALWLVAGLHYLIAGLLAPRLAASPRMSRVGAALALALALAVVPGVSLITQYAAQDLRNDTSAIDYARQVAATTEPNALVIAQTERHVFTLWYYQQALDPRWSATVVSAELVQYDWYVAQVQRRHPGLGIPADSNYAARLRGLVGAALPVRPVYLTDPNEHIEAAYVVEKRGPLYRITGPKPQ